MKALQAILALFLVCPTSAKAQQPSPNKIHYPSVAELKSNSLARTKIWAEYSKTHTQAQVDAEFRSNTIARVEKEVAEYSKTRSPYIRFADGKVVYLGKLLYEHGGILEATPVQGGVGTVMLFTQGYTIVHSMSNGCHIKFPDSIRRDGTVDRSEMFVQGLPSKTNQVHQRRLVAQFLGEYVCDSGSAGSHTIPSWTLGEDATKEDYLDYVASTKKKP